MQTEVEAMDAVSEDLRKAARERLEAQRGVVPHLLVYVLVNAGLVAIWATVADRGFFWPGFVIGFWGIGIVMHIWSAFFRRPITEAEIDREVENLRGRSGGMHAV
jgi:2TM domain